MIIFLYGDDTYRSRRKLNELKTKYFQEIDKDKNSLVDIDGESMTIGELNEAVSASSLFVRKRMVIVERLLKNKDRKTIKEAGVFLKSLSDKDTDSDEAIIVFWEDSFGSKPPANSLFRLLARQKYAQEFKPFSNTQTTTWIKKEVAKRGAKIKHEAAVHLSGLFGDNLWILNNELNKLISFKSGTFSKLVKGGKESVIEAEDIGRLSRGKVDENIFAFVDAMSQRRKGQALELFEQELTAGVAEQYLLFMIVRQFRILLQAKQALDAGGSQKKIMSQLKLHPFVARKSISQARNFTLPLLKRIMSHLIEMDSAIKTGKNDLRTGLSLMMAKL